MKIAPRFANWQKPLLCLLTSALAAGVFVVGFAMLPQARLPLWLPLLAALCGGGLCAWFLFVPKALRREKNFRLWGARLASIACAALLVSLCLELFGFNHRAFVTRDCEPYELSLSLFQDASGYLATDEEDAIPLYATEAEEYVIWQEELNETTLALGLTFSGNATPLSFTIRVQDEASYYVSMEANHGLCVPGLPELNAYYGALYSNGELSTLTLSFALQAGQSARLTSVTLNPKVPVSLSPLRIGLWALGLFLLLCMGRFPWRQVIYRPEKWSHRLVLLAPMLLFMALNLTMSVLCTSESDPRLFRSLLDGNAPDAVLQNSEDKYGQLFLAFQNGQLHLIPEPGEDLLALYNPYDPTERGAEGVDYIYDCAMYEGHYYVYFGPGPVLLFHAPFYALTGRLPTPLLCAALIALIAIPLITYATEGFVRKYIPSANLFLLSLCCLTLCFVAGWPYLSTAASYYENAYGLNIAMMAGALGFGFHACIAQKGGKRALLFVLSGLCFALQAMCRANTLLITTVFLAPSYIALLCDPDSRTKEKLRDSLCFLLPAFAGVGAVMWYNFARFGSPAEFGQLYQLTTEDIRYNTFRLESIPQALWHFFFDMPAFSDTFPYITTQASITNVTGNYLWYSPNVGIFAYPYTWCLLGLIPFLRRNTALSRWPDLQRRATLSLPLLVSLTLIVVSYFYAGLSQRYVHDFLFVLGLLSAYPVLTACRGRDDSELKRLFSTLFVLLCFLSMVAAIAFGLLNDRIGIYANSPGTYFQLARMFFPY